jgi:putative transposase
VACHRVDSEYYDYMSKGEVQKGCHCAWQIHYQLVFPVKYRKVLLDEMVVRIIEETAIGIQERYAIEMEALGMDKDHIHLLCAAHPKIAPGEIVRIFKSITAREIFRKYPQIKKELWGGEFWSDGYYAATVGERGNWSQVEKYIQKQGKPKEDLKQIRLF